MKYISHPFLLVISIIIMLVYLSGCQQASSVKGAGMVYATGTAAFNKVIDQATMMHDSGMRAASVRYLDSAFHQMKPQNHSDQFHFYGHFSSMYSREDKDWNKAGIYCDSMIMIAEKYKDDKDIIAEAPTAYFSKGDIEFHKGNYDESYKNYYKGETLAKDKVDDCVLSDYNYRLGMVLYKQERFEDAAENFKLALNEARACAITFPQFYRNQEILDNIGLCYSNLTNYDSALAYFYHAQAYIDTYANTFPNRPVAAYDPARAVIYGNEATVYSKQHNNKKAKELLQKGIEINSMPHHDMNDAQLSRLKLADIYIGEGNAVQGKIMLQEVKTILDSLPNKKVEIGWNNAMWQYYDYVNDAPTAYSYLRNYNRLRDSMDVKNKQLRETDMGDRIKNLDRQYQINILKKNNALKQTYLVIAALLTLLSISVMLFVYQNWRRSRTNVTVLSSLNEQINQQKNKLQEILTELEASNRDKDRILSAVAHDIRNPIAAITSLTELLLAETDNNYTEEQKQLIEYIRAACQDALTLTKEILIASQPKSNEKLVKEKTDINLLLHDCIDMMRFRANEKHQHITLKMATDMPAMLLNRDRIWRVISNLVTNAIKFSPDGAMIDVIAQKITDHVHISVHDQGIGIPDKIKDRVFEMFTEAKRPGTAGEKPFGLGLAISKQIVLEHNGKIWFESNETGTTFHFTLPIDAALTSQS